MFGLGLDNSGRTTKHAYGHIYSLCTRTDAISSPFSGDVQSQRAHSGVNQLYHSDSKFGQNGW